MIWATLQRRDWTDAGTFGEIECLGFKWATGELPWRDNQKHISCVPEGVYRAVWTFSPRFQRFTYLVQNVPDRDAIRIHPANWVGDKAMGFRSQLDGCIALGEGISYADKKPFLLNSAPAVRLFENRLKGETFTLQILNPLRRVP